MNYSEIKATAQLEVISDMGRVSTVGIIGTAEKSGAGFICDLLRREASLQGRKIEILDMGEDNGLDGSKCKLNELGMILVVVDSRLDLPPQLPELLFRLERRAAVKIGIVLNRWMPDQEIARVKTKELSKNFPVFVVPEIRAQSFRELYNFVFV